MYTHDLERFDNSYILDKGYIYLSKTPATVHSVLGSAVSVCLWDRQKKIGAMNHFVQPVAEKAGLATAKFGNAAMLAMYKMMIDCGCRASDMVAQVFGGAFPEHDPNHNIGSKNVEVARNFLKKKRIKVVSEDVGGNLGRKIIFDTTTGRVAVLKVEQIRSSDWV